MVVLWACLFSHGAVINYPNVAAGAPSAVTARAPSVAAIGAPLGSSLGLFWDYYDSAVGPISDSGLSCFSTLLQALSLCSLGCGSWRNLLMVEEAEPRERAGLFLFLQRLLKRAQMMHFRMLASKWEQPVYISFCTCRIEFYSIDGQHLVITQFD